MLHDTSTPTGGTGAATAPSVTLDDDEIISITGITLLDCPAELINQRLQGRGWADRAQYFNNIICSSFERLARMLAYVRSEDHGVAFLQWANTEMMRRVAEVLELWGASDPADADAAALFHLSLNPRHRRAAESWTNRDEYLASRHFFDTYVQENWLALAAFFNLCAMSDICVAAAWRAGPVACSGEWFDLPGWMA